MLFSCCTPMNRKICIYLLIFLFAFLASLSIKSNVSAMEMPTVDASDTGSFSLVYQPCYESTYNGRTYYNCDNSRTRDFTRSVVNNEDGTTTQIFTYEVPDDILGSGKYIRIQRLTYSPSSDFVSSGDNVFYSVSSSYSPYLGSARPFISNDTGTRYVYTMGGFNAYIWSSRWNDMFGCPEQNSDVCQLKFDWDTTTGLGSGFYVSNAFTMPSGWSQFGGIDLLHNLYDSTDESYYWTPYPDNSTLFMLNTWNDIRYSNGSAYLQFQVQFYKLSEFYDMSESGGVDVNDAITAERDYIDSDLGDASSIMNNLNLNFTLINPLQPIFNAFTDITCHDFTYLPAMFGAGTTRICSPWRNNLRTYLTPVAIIMFNLILYRFIITWFKKGDQI